MGAAALSGGGATVIQFAKANNLANASSVINIINNVIAGNGSQAVVGIVSLMLGLKNTKTLTRFYASYIRNAGSTGILLRTPPRFLFIVDAIIDTASMILEEGIFESFDKWIIGIY